MGNGNSKPSNVSDAVWNKVQREKLDLITKKEQEAKDLEKIRQEKCRQLTVDFADYCHKCHDVPKIMMLFPSFRKDCSEARKRVLEDISDQIDIAKSMGTAQQVANATKHSH